MFLKSLLTSLRARLYWWSYRFRGAINDAKLIVDPRHQIRLSQERRKAADDQRVLATWYAAAEEVGLDLSPAAIRARLMPTVGEAGREAVPMWVDSPLDAREVIVLKDRYAA